MTDKAKTVYDLEFWFTNGQTLFFCAEEGRDTIAADDARVKLLLRPDDTTLEEIIIQRSSVACMKTTKRTVEPDPDDVNGVNGTKVDQL